MSELSAIQNWLAEVLRQRRAVPKDEVVATQAGQYVTGNVWLSPAEQVEIYREQFWLRHTSALVEDFPGLGGVIGQSDWERLVEAYLVRYAPRSWTLRDLGDRFADYVEHEASWLPQHRLCVDMARLEWAYVEVFDAPDQAPLDGTKLQSISPEAWETARIVLSDALRLLRVEYPVGGLRRKLRDASESATPAAGIVIPEASPRHLVVYRGSNRSLFFRSVTPVAFAVLQGLHEEIPLVPACERAIEQLGADPDRVQALVGEWFAEWARLGWIVDVQAVTDVA